MDDCEPLLKVCLQCGKCEKKMSKVSDDSKLLVLLIGPDAFSLTVPRVQEQANRFVLLQQGVPNEGLGNSQIAPRKTSRR
jgi:hypothetical protein